jgi:transposase
MTWGRLLWWVLLLSAACCWCESVSGRPVSEDLRWRAVLLHEDDGLAYAKIAALLRLSESSCRRYVRLWYKQHYLRPAGRARERNPIPLEHMEFLQGILRRDAALYLSEMRNELRQEFGRAVFYDEKKISKALLAAGYTRKVLTTFAMQQDAALRGRYKRLVTSGMFHPDQCIWIDEVRSAPGPPDDPLHAGLPVSGGQLAGALGMEGDGPPAARARQARQAGLQLVSVRHVPPVECAGGDELARSCRLRGTGARGAGWCHAPHRTRIFTIAISVAHHHTPSSLLM